MLLSQRVLSGIVILRLHANVVRSCNGHTLWHTFNVGHVIVTNTSVDIAIVDRCSAPFLTIHDRVRGGAMVDGAAFGAEAHIVRGLDAGVGYRAIGEVVVTLRGVH